MDCLVRLARELEARRPASLLTVVAAPPHSPLRPGCKWLVGPEGLLVGDGADPDVVAPLVEEGRDALEQGFGGTRDVELHGVLVRIYVEPYLPPPVLIIVGAGHIAQALARMATLTGFEVWVLDDRKEYASAEKFPTADRIVCAPFIEGLEAMDLGLRHDVVLVTRGHRHDMRCLHYLISRPLAYIGMIGSRTRVNTVFQMLVDDRGVDPASLERVHAPIGLDIGARTPAEIAVSVTAELVKVRRGGTGESLSRLKRALIHDPRLKGR